MTNEELDEARARDALSKRQHGLSWDNLTQASRDTLTLAARYGREGWTPTDPDLVLAREVYARTVLRMRQPDPGRRNELLEKDLALGYYDQHSDKGVQIALAAIRAARGGQS